MATTSPDDRGVVPGSEPQPGPDWTKGIDGNWYAPARRRRPPPPPPEAAATPTPKATKAIGGAIVVVAIAAIAALIIGVVAILRDQSGVRSITSSTAHKPGDTVASGAFNVTVNAIRTHYVPSAGFDAAPTGAFLATVDITVKNVGTHDGDVAAALLFDLIDANGAVAPQTSVTELVGVDGLLHPDEERRGFVVFRVADASPAPLRFRVKGTLTGDPEIFQLR